MLTLIIIVFALLLLGGGGYYGHRSGWYRGGYGGVGPTPGVNAAGQPIGQSGQIGPTPGVNAAGQPIGQPNVNPTDVNPPVSGIAGDDRRPTHF